MTRPSWQQGDPEKEQEYQKLLKQQGERESFQRDVNFMAGDHLGLEDGRPGFGFGLGFDGPVMTMPLSTQITLGIGGLLLIALLAFGTRACIGEERAQEILTEQPAAVEGMDPGK